MNREVLVVVASCSPDQTEALAEAARELAPDLPLYVVSEFPPRPGTWIPWHFSRSVWTNLARCRAELDGARIRFVAVQTGPNPTFRRLRILAHLLAPLRCVYFNEHLKHFMLRPRSAITVLRHMKWRLRNLIVYECHPGGRVYTLLWRVRHPREFERPLLFRRALRAGGRVAGIKRNHVARTHPVPRAPLQPGITVVIPSRNGKELLARCLPPVMEQEPDQIVVVDNGSDDRTLEWLLAEYPAVEVESGVAALTFAEAVNLGIAHARHSHVCLLNNDMEIEAGFFAALRTAFERVPDLFCATAQIFFPRTQRREETGKAVMPPVAPDGPRDVFPLRCDLPVEGEDLSYVLYGSGGCSLFDTAKLREVGFDEAYVPAYVEDLDTGFRGWQRGWPTVYCDRARVLHRHRSTTSRYFSEEQIETAIEVNYLRFLLRAVADAPCFSTLWTRAIRRLNARGAGHVPSPVALAGLRFAAAGGDTALRRPVPAIPDAEIFALGSGDIAVFPGRGADAGPRVIVASCYLPYPLSHGGAVRMYNLMRRAAGMSQVLITFVDDLETPPDELLDICVEVVLVRRRGTHRKDSKTLPAVVEEFRSSAFHAALKQTVRKWQPDIVQLEFTQMAQYAEACAPARTLLIEHDVTVDLYRQLFEHERLPGQRWELRRQLALWETFERAAWTRVDRVVTMSERDREMVGTAAFCLPNGVDIERYQPAAAPPEPRRLLFIGSFAHLPNLLAMGFFLEDVLPMLGGNTALHIIAGARHNYYLDFYRDRARVNFARPGVELEGFVSDVRPAYARAGIVVAPLKASAGTNIKILEAMAMGKAIVSTPEGVHGLDLVAGEDFALVDGAEQMAAEIHRLREDGDARRRMERSARAAVEARYSWDGIAQRQDELYRTLRAKT